MRVEDYGARDDRAGHRPASGFVYAGDVAKAGAPAVYLIAECRRAAIEGRHTWMLAGERDRGYLDSER